MLMYIAKNEGAFGNIGGGLSIGTCTLAHSAFWWPLVEIDGRLFLRGTELTGSHSKHWPAPEKLEYDEAWCATLDRRFDLAGESAPGEAFGGTYSDGSGLPGFDLDEITAESVFDRHTEPDVLYRDENPKGV